MSFAFAFEQSTDHRRAPAVTPPLVDSAAPQPRTFLARVNLGAESGVGVQSFASATFVLDPTRNTLRFDVEFDELAADRAYGATLHIRESGPAFARVATPGYVTSVGILDLTPLQRQAVDDGEVRLRVFTAHDPGGGSPIRLIFDLS